MLNDRTTFGFGRWVLVAAVCGGPIAGWGQTATDLCGLTAGAQYPVGTNCVNKTFNLPASFTSSLNPGTCNAGANDDAWGWFRATSNYTTVQYQGNQDAILHVYTGSCSSLQYVSCSDIMGTALPESVTIPTVVNQDYFVRIQRYGSDAGMNGNLCVYTANPTTSCGTTVYDSGGPSGNYSNNERRFITYCPPVPGQAVTLNFTSFSLENNYDILTVFSGSGSGGTFLGQFTGATLPPTLTSTDPSGCITLVFFSDGSSTNPGWGANVSCNTAPDCFYVLTLNDSYGDGWGSSRVGYSINGGPFQYWTLGAGQSIGQVVIPLNVGDIFVLDYIATGPWQGENSFTVSIQGQSVVYSSGTPPIPGQQFPHAVDCIPPPAAQEDCIGGFTICSDQAFNNNSLNSGSVVDLTPVNRGCLLGNEGQGTWYFFSPITSGTVAFTIQPTANIDYDFAVWGPLPAVTCPPPGPPVRCSWSIGETAYDIWGFPIGGTYYSTGSYNTGMRAGAGDNSEGVQGDGWVNPLPVTAGMVYILYINNYDLTAQPFDLNWSLTDGASLNCDVLPVQLVDLKAVPKDNVIEVEWITQVERDVELFVVQRGSNAQDLQTIGTVRAEGGPSQWSGYRFIDNEPVQGINFYRLITVGNDGQEEASKVVTARMGITEPLLVPNPASGLAVLYTATMAPSGSVLRITDASGRTVQESVITNEGMQHNVDMGGLSNGVYVLFLHTADGAPLGHSRFVKE